MRHRGFWLSVGALMTAWSSFIIAQGSPSSLYNAIRTNDLARLQAMVHSAADANTKDDGGKTPLMYAAAVGSIDAVKFLIDMGADVDAQNDSGLTALMLAATDLPKVRRRSRCQHQCDHQAGPHGTVSCRDERQLG